MVALVAFVKRNTRKHNYKSFHFSVIAAAATAGAGAGAGAGQ